MRPERGNQRKVGRGFSFPQSGLAVQTHQIQKANNRQEQKPATKSAPERRAGVTLAVHEPETKTTTQYRPCHSRLCVGLRVLLRLLDTATFAAGPLRPRSRVFLRSN